MKQRARRLLRAGLARRLAVVNLVALLPLAILLLLQTQALINEADGNSSQAATGRTLQAAQVEINAINMAQTLAQTLATLPYGLITDDATCEQIVLNAARANPKLSLVGYVPVSGQVTCSSRDVAVDLSGDPRFVPETAATTASLFLDPYGRGGDRAVLTATHPVLTPEGGLAGTVVVALPHETVMFQEGSAGHGLSERPVALITFDREGHLLTSSLGLDYEVQPLPLDQSLSSLAEGGQKTFTAMSLGGRERVFSVTPISDQVFLIGTWALEAETAALSVKTGPYLLAALMGVSGLVAAIFAAERLVVRHIRSLVASMNEFPRKKGGVVIPKLVDPPAEFKDMARVYADMVSTIVHEEAALENLVREKEYLLREVHHRTGNSLQLIASILRMHIRENPTPEVRNVLEHVYGRVVGLSSVHLGLYRLAGSTNAGMAEILSDVIVKIDQMHNRQGREGRIVAELAPFDLAARQAVPLALLLSEVLSAYLESEPPPGATPVTVMLTLDSTHSATLRLTGTPAARPLLTGVGGGATASIASRLIRGFVRQLDGDQELSDFGDRLSFAVTFVIRQAAATSDQIEGGDSPPVPLAAVQAPAFAP